ncbi:hypothetical protein PISMIDRAFT_681623 [Pisolithus microcarpus 441]|uniref:Uncharacterized protein n=1 Tax=Pisolithus microcarpus 441 TaxID=765257 RepID=A0A0C9Y958_9AGAM|nr:hypothetical protein PISMIDRAFT_681623 [Pisolithus microcarpus 441]
MLIEIACLKEIFSFTKDALPQTPHLTKPGGWGCIGLPKWVWGIAQMSRRKRRSCATRTAS